MFKALALFILIGVQNESNAITFSPFRTRRTVDPYHHQEILGADGNFTLEWRVNWETRTVEFNISADTEGYIGLGLSHGGGISGSDFVIGGVDSKGMPYISDMHGMPDGTLHRDYKEDWKLIDANKSGGHTYLSFSRSFHTCDDQDDIRINDDLLHLIWMYGDTDEVTLYTPHVGSFPVYLLDPDPSTEQALQIYRQLGPHSNLYLMQLWRASIRLRLLPQTNSQVCSIVKGLELNQKHYILGGGAYLPHEAGDHVRQIILTRCVPPEGANASTIFESFSNIQGEECSGQSSPTIPMQFCSEKIFVWGQGGRPFYFPEETGIPIGTTRDEYFMLQIQLINPNRFTDLDIKAGFDLMIHPRPKMYEIGVLTVGYSADSPFVIPPRSPMFSIYGHCSPQCTRNMIPNGDLEVFAAMIQMRSVGYSGRLKHFRGNTELPWILKDDNYNSTFQQIRLLPHWIKILPGDQLSVECTYDSSNLFNATVSGSANNEEQCVAHLFVTPPLNSSWCSSEYPANHLRSRLGIQNFTRSVTSPRRLTNVPERSTNPNFLASLSNTRWTLDVEDELQREMAFGAQLSSCPSRDGLIQPVVRNVPTARGRRLGQPVSSSGSTTSGTASVALPVVSVEYKQAPEDCERDIS